MRFKTLAVLVMLGVGASMARAGEVDPKIQAKIDAAVKEVQGWVSDAAIVDGVKGVNASPSADNKAMTQDKWKALPMTDAFVRSLAKNATATFLRSKKSEIISEAFVSAADGTKVAFLAKTTNWSHKGKAKHDDPMAGKLWQGDIEVDASTGVQQVQIGLPVKDGDKVIGSLVVGLNVSKLKE